MFGDDNGRPVWRLFSAAAIKLSFWRPKTLGNADPLPDNQPLFEHIRVLRFDPIDDRTRDDTIRAAKDMMERAKHLLDLELFNYVQHLLITRPDHIKKHRPLHETLLTFASDDVLASRAKDAVKFTKNKNGFASQAAVKLEISLVRDILYARPHLLEYVQKKMREILGEDDSESVIEFRRMVDKLASANQRRTKQHLPLRRSSGLPSTVSSRLTAAFGVFGSRREP